MRIVLLLLSAAIAGLLAGCTSANSLTGGSVPIGTIDGWVYRSVTLEALTRQAPTLEPASNFTVELVRGDDQVVQTTTDSDGYFIFRNVPKGPVRIHAGQHSTLYAEVQTEVERNGDHVGVALMLAPEIAAAAASLRITPAAVVDAHPGDEIVFSAQLLTSTGETITVPASWALKGGLGSMAPRLPAGSVTPGGLFRADTPGSGRVIAQYKGLTAVAPITVLSAGVNL